MARGRELLHVSGGAMPTLCVNVSLYVVLLLAALYIWPERPAVAHGSRRIAAHVMILLFAAIRVFWAVYLLAIETTHPPPYNLPANQWDLCLDTLCVSILLATTAAIVVQVADTLLVGYRSSRHLWRVLRIFIAFLAIYQLFVTGTAIDISVQQSESASKRLLHVLEHVQPPVLGGFSLFLLIAILLVIRLYSRQATPSILTRYRFARRAIVSLGVIFTGSFIVRSGLWLAYDDVEVRLWLWLCLSHWLPELLPSMGLMLLLRTLTTTRLLRTRSSSVYVGPLFPSTNRAATSPLLPNFTTTANTTPSHMPSAITEGTSTSINRYVGMDQAQAGAPFKVVYEGIPCDNGQLRLIETIRGSAFSWSIPAAWLALIVKERYADAERLHHQLVGAQAHVNIGTNNDNATQFAAIAGDGEGADTVDLLERLKQELRGERKQPEISWRKAQLRRLEAYLVDILGLAPLLHRATWRGLSFKPSTAKKEQALRYVPTNLQIQRLEVQALHGEHNTLSAEGSYVFVTTGAPAAHALGFKSGGILHIDERIEKCEREQAETSDSQYAAYLGRKIESLRSERNTREEIAISQALPAIAALFCARLEQEIDKIRMNFDENSLKECITPALSVWTHLGFVVGWESLLSTYGNELHMLGDAYGAIKRLSDIGLVITLVSDDRNEECSADPPGAEDMDVSVSGSTKGAFAPSTPVSSLQASIENLAANARKRGVNVRRDDVGRIKLELRVGKNIWQYLPHSLNQGRSIRIVIVLISQGINAQQTVANAMGGDMLQTRINLESTWRLRRFSEEMRDVVGQRNADLDCVLSMLERNVASSRSEKNVKLIALSEQIIPLLHGGRMTSCKSAKDRTSMAITAEQVQLLLQNHGLRASEASSLTDKMRAHGVRWHNMRQNVAHGQYAFNWLQQQLLPKIYRAPDGTYSGRSKT